MDQTTASDMDSPACMLRSFSGNMRPEEEVGDLPCHSGIAVSSLPVFYPLLNGEYEQFLIFCDIFVDSSGTFSLCRETTWEGNTPKNDCCIQRMAAGNQEFTFDYLRAPRLTAPRSNCFHMCRSHKTLYILSRK